MKYLITGGAGFIGSHLISNIINEADKVIVLDNLLTGSKKNIEKFLHLENFEFHSHDIQNHYEISEKVDFVIHLASCASPLAYTRYPINTLKSGSIGTINALGIARKFDSKFLLSSTSEIYGNPKVSPQGEDYWGNVNPTGPRSMYDESKRFAEAYVTEYDLNASIIRIFNTYGENMQLSDGRVVTNFIVQALNNQNITVYGDGHQTRSFSYIEDTVRGLLLALNYPKSDIFNIGNDNEMSISDLATLIIKLTESNSKIIFKDLPVDDPMQRKPNLKKSKDILGYKPTVNIEIGLSKTIEWIKNNLNNST
jgi:dTDP-glucose 4,6-dehydratase